MSDGTSFLLAQHLIPGTDEAFYIPEFVSAEEEDFVIRKIKESPLPKWKQLTNRRLQIWGGSMSAKGVLIPAEMPPFVTQYPDIIGRIKATGAFDSSPHGAPNHIIMNEYLPGQGIMAHEDGPAYHPAVATLSLGAHALFHYYRYTPDAHAVDPAPVLSVLLEPRSLVVTRAALYAAHLHGIDGVHADVFPPCARVANAGVLAGGAVRELVHGGGTLARGPRYSLTCRDVARVASGLPALKR